MMKPANFVVVCLVAVGGSSQAVLGQETRVTVKVIDKRSSPVISTVVLNPGRHRLGRTQADGVYKFSHSCKTGETLRAEPEDGAKYYYSGEEVCAKVVVLEVFPRPQDWGSADFFHIQEVHTPAGFSKVYAGVFASATDKVDPVVEGEKKKCKLTIDKKFNVAYYNAKMTDWALVTDIPNVGAKQDDVTYYFPTTCEDAWKKIGEIKKQTNRELEALVLDYYTTNSQEIDTAVVKAATPPK